MRGARWRDAFAVSGAMFRQTVRYRFNIILYTVGTVLQLMVMNAIWTSLAANGQIPGGLGSPAYQSLVTYSTVAFTMSLAFAIFPIYSYLAEVIKKGDIAMEFVRPLDFMANLFLRYLGFSVFRVAFLCLPFLVLAGLIGGLQLPPDGLHLALFLLSVLLGYLLQFFIWFMFALLGFISLDNAGIFMTFVGLSNFLSGLYLPLGMFPDWLANIAWVLPFRGLYAIPLGYWSGGTTELWQGLAFQAAWLLALALLGRLAWRGIARRVIVQGG